MEAALSGFLGAATLLIKGRFEVHGCVIRQSGGTNEYDLYDSKVSITGNTYRDSFEAMDVGQMENTDYVFSHNQVSNISAWSVYIVGPWTSSSITVDHNLFTGVNGHVWTMR